MKECEEDGDEVGYVPFTAVGSELLFEVFSQRYERGATLVTSNLPFDEWTSVLGFERLTGALLDRLTHHVHILEMNGESFRLATSKKAQRRSGQSQNANPKNVQTKEGRDRKLKRCRAHCDRASLRAPPMCAEENKQGLRRPFSLNPTGTLSSPPPLHNLSAALTRGRTRPSRQSARRIEPRKMLSAENGQFPSNRSVARAINPLLAI